MSGDRFDYRSERARHENFVGRAGLLARLDQLLVEDAADRWVVITGGPGMGKSALLAAWLARRVAAGAVVPHHFIRRGLYDWDDPAKLVGSLVAQIEDGFPELREPEADERMHPAMRLSRALSRVSEQVLVPRGARLVVLIDGLDEYDPPPERSTGDPLAAFLPDTLPAGVRLLCASRPRHPYVSSLDARDCELVQIDLDDPSHAADNDATVRAFWNGTAEPLHLDARFVDEAVARAGGNVQHAVQLRKRLAVLPPDQRRVEDIPRGLAALIEKAWARVAGDPAVVAGLGILCAAREALTLDEIGAVADWGDDPRRRTWVRAAKELLVETQRPGGQLEYRLHHDAIRGYVAQAIGDDALRAHHRALARRYATWPAPGQADARRYALRHALIHRAEAGDWAKTWRLAGDMRFLEAKCRELGVHEAEVDITRVAERCRASDDAVIARRLDDLARALRRDSHWLSAAPEATAGLVWNRLRRFGWSADELDEQLRGVDDADFLRVRHAVTRESPALVRDLVGHAGGVNACAVTLDGRRVVSASADRTLKVWDLATGQPLATLEGHDDGVKACAVTPDGRRVVSASGDGRLRVWEFETWRPLATLVGHADGVNACAVTPDGRRVISASADKTLKVWDLTTGIPIATLEGHTDRVTACAVTPDGRCVVSASGDKTLKVWDLETGRLLASLEGHTDGVRACAVTPDGRRVVSASWDKTLKVWDLETGRPLTALEGHANGVNSCAVTLDGWRVVSASYDNTLKVWDLETWRPLATLEGHANGVNSCAVTPDGRRVVSASWDKTLKIWDLDTGRPSASLEGHANGVNSCAVTPDGRRVVSASADCTLKIWDLETGRPLATLEGHAGGVNACAMTLDGRRVVSASADKTLKVWDPEARQPLATLEGHARMVRACAVTSHGRRVISAAEDRALKVWDLETGRPVATLQGHADWVRACAVTPDGQRVVSASDDKTVKVWDLETGRPLATLEGHADGVRACAVTPDGQRVVSASWDRTLKVWDLETYACLLTHRGDAPYAAVATSATAIVAGDATGGLWFLDWPPSRRRTTPDRVNGSDDRPRSSDRSHVPLSPRPQMTKHTILFLAANPLGTDQRALDREARTIHEELERSGHRDQFELVTRWAAQPLDLLRELRKLRPSVVHFSGPSRIAACDVPRTGEARQDVVTAPSASGVEHERGLIFQGLDGRAQWVSTAAIKDTFGAAGSSVKVVVLNACYSEPQAEALAAHVDCVVGMGGSFSDAAARSFAIGFYGGLGERESVAVAYNQGCAAIGLEGQAETDRPRLKVRSGVDATRLVLAAAPVAADPP